MSKKRSRMSRSKSRKNFSKGSKTHVRNLNSGAPMRGGIRL